MDPRFWGPGLWKFLHATAAVSTTDEKRRDFVTLVQALAKTLPCERCRTHFKQNLRSIPISNYLRNERTLFMWTYLMHDAVNAAQGKTGAARPSFEEVYQRYFRVSTDQGVTSMAEYKTTICKHVCAESQTESQPRTVVARQQKPQISLQTRKYKTRK